MSRLGRIRLGRTRLGRTRLDSTRLDAWLAAHGDLDRLDREVLLGRAAGLSRARILAHPELPLEAAVVERLAAWAARRRRGEPLAYILGSREFWGLSLEVSPAVLVPRPETELLVQIALDHLAGVSPGAAAGDDPGASDSRPGGRCYGVASRVLELGTGSGAVALALAHERPDLRITATDVSPTALAVAARNGERLGLAVEWRTGDWFRAVTGRFAMILSNPPYVAEQDPHLPALAHEPRRALVAGPDGLDAIRRIVAGTPGHLLPGGVLALEHGCDQGSAVRALLRAAGFADVDSHRDLAGLDRVSTGRRPEAGP